jgi:prevent-host-death family protein
MYMRMYISGMAHTYSIAEARSSLPTIVDQAEAGHEVELTRRGKPVAVVVSIRQFERLRRDRPSFGEAYEAFLGQHALDKVGTARDFAASVRDKAAGRKVSW